MKIKGFEKDTFIHIHFAQKDVLKSKPNGFDRGTFIVFEDMLL